MLLKRIPAVLAILAIGLLSGRCGRDESPTDTPIVIIDPVDTIPPAAISNLLAKVPTTSSIYLQWTAPGDDGMEGTADSYDIRYSTEQITKLNWDNASQFDGEPSPGPGGQMETVNIDGLDLITTYYFAVKTTDDKGNTSGLSNSVSETTLNESTPPWMVDDLEAVATAERVFLLTWTAPGDDGIVGTASQYEIRHSQSPITVANWDAADIVANPPIPKSSGEVESLLVTQLRSPLNYYFALKSSDEVPNESEMSNVAFGMGYIVNLVILDTHVQQGEEVEIMFRVPPGGAQVHMNLNRYGIMGCDPTHAWVMANLILGKRYEEGTYKIYFDFKDVHGDYLPRTLYYVVLCWDYAIETTHYIYFEDPQ